MCQDPERSSRHRPRRTRPSSPRSPAPRSSLADQLLELAALAIAAGAVRRRPGARAHPGNRLLAGRPSARARSPRAGDQMDPSKTMRGHQYDKQGIKKDTPNWIFGDAHQPGVLTSINNRRSNPSCKTHSSQTQSGMHCISHFAVYLRYVLLPAVYGQ
jgi:hypothetical protein